VCEERRIPGQQRYAIAVLKSAALHSYDAALDLRIGMWVEGDPNPANNGLFYLLTDDPSANSGQASAARP
jgi:hypothetical protein